VKVKLRRDAEGPPKDSASSESGPGDSSGRSGGADDSNATPDPGQEHSSDEDADGEVDTEATTSSGNNDTGSESDPFEDAEPGRKRALRGPPADSERRGHGGKHAGGNADASRTGVGRHKRIHRDERDMDEHPQDG
jgi:hypothetical protein